MTGAFHPNPIPGPGADCNGILHPAGRLID